MAWQRKGFQIIFVLVLVVEVEVDGDIDEVFVLVIVFLGCRGSSQPAHLLIIVAGLKHRHSISIQTISLQNCLTLLALISRWTER